MLVDRIRFCSWNYSAGPPSGSCKKVKLGMDEEGRYEPRVEN